MCNSHDIFGVKQNWDDAAQLIGHGPAHVRH